MPSPETGAYAATVSLYDVLLGLHVFGAFALTGAITLLSIGIVATWRAQQPSDIVRLAGIRRAGDRLMAAGITITLVFGVWLAIEVDGYHVWDGWVLAALALWAVAAETGRRAADAHREIGAEAARLVQSGDAAELRLAAKARGVQALGMHAASTAAVLLVLVDMIWKPGA
jgi:uncharacterized membrane protein